MDLMGIFSLRIFGRPYKMPGLDPVGNKLYVYVYMICNDMFSFPKNSLILLSNLCTNFIASLLTASNFDESLRMKHDRPR